MSFFEALGHQPYVWERNFRRTLIAGAALSVLMTGAAMAQETTESDSDDSLGTIPLETVTVTGYRASLEASLLTKKMSNSMVDTINAEDVAKFPDSNLAESLQRLPGVSVTRENGEGRTITVRGLGADFTRVTINGMEALSTAGGTLAGDTPNRSRQFDFNTFAAELFSKLKVQKSASAEADEGSLGATVGLYTGRPFQMGNKVALSVNNALYERGHAFNPRLAALFSHNWLGGRLGTLFSVAYNMRDSSRDYYSNGAGGYAYRAGSSSGTFVGTPTPEGDDTIMTRDGFAAPTGTSCSGEDGVIPGLDVTNTAYCDLLSGSDSTAYDAVNSPRGHTIDSDGNWTTAASTTEVGVPALARQEIYQTRLGLTGTVQWQPDDNTIVSADVLFSSFYQKSTSNMITAIGLSRNNTYTALATATSTSDLSSAFTQCTVTTATATKAANECSFSSSMSVYDYYTNSSSVGYDASDPNGLNFLMARVGRPATKIVSADVTNDIADYLELDNVDVRTIADQSRATTQFQQGTLNVTHEFSDDFHIDALIGWAKSHNHSEGLFATFDTFDRGTSNGDDSNYTYDIRGKEYALKELGFGFDTADTSNWSFIKGYSDLRRYIFITDNRYTNMALNTSYRVLDQLRMKFGFAHRAYDFYTTRYTRVVNTTFNPSLEEMGLDISDVSRTVSFDASALGLGGSTPTRFVVPDIDKISNKTGLRCNCVNAYGDWRMTNLNSSNSSNNMLMTFAVAEHDNAYFLQADFQDIWIFGNELRGNIGLRYATTSVGSSGYSITGSMIHASNSYDDILPAVNLVYAFTDSMMLRFGAAKVMSRPVLADMAPSISSLSISSTLGGTGSVKMGNPNLKPFRANTIDASYEWYFARGSLFSVAVFAKYIKNNPQSQTTSGKLSDFLTDEQIDIVAANYDADSNKYQNLYDDDVSWNVTTYRNAPGGVLEGVELNFQQQMRFLPAPFDGLGINANYTYVKSKMHYMFKDSDSDGELVDHIAPWKGSSPNSINGTVYYEAKTWSARVSTSFRSHYVSSYPVRSGAYLVGYGNSPSINEFVYGESTLYVSTSMSYKVNEFITARLDAMNLTDEHTRKYWLYEGKTKRRTYDSVGGRSVFMGFTVKY